MTLNQYLLDIKAILFTFNGVLLARDVVVLFYFSICFFVFFFLVACYYSCTYAVPKINTNDISILNFNSIVMNLNSISTLAQKPVGNRSETGRKPFRVSRWHLGYCKILFPFFSKGLGCRTQYDMLLNRTETVSKPFRNCY